MVVGSCVSRVVLLSLVETVKTTNGRKFAFLHIIDYATTIRDKRAQHICSFPSTSALLSASAKIHGT